jgi:hypothetical protein
MITTELIVIIIVVFIIFTLGSIFAFAGMVCGGATMLQNYAIKTKGEADAEAEAED